MSDQTTLEVVLSSESTVGNPIVETVVVVGTVPVGPRGIDGTNGTDGVDGTDGVGVPTGGTAGQVLTKDSGTDFDTSWQDSSGGIETIVPGSNIDVDATDPANPIVSVEALVDADIPASIARDAEVTAAVAAEATARDAAIATHSADTTGVHGITDTSALVLDDDPRLTDDRDPTAHAASHQDGGTDELALDGSQITTGTVADARIAATIARDSEVTAAVSTSEAGQVRDGDAAGGVLSGTYPNPGFAADMATQAELDAHIADAADAHDASAISFVPAGTIAATTVQAAIEEVASEAGGAAGSIDDLTDVDTTTIPPDDGDVLAWATDQWVPATPSGEPSPHAASHENGGTDELALDASQVTTGTFDDARIPAGITRDAEAAAAYQPLDADLTALAALAPSNDDIVQRKAGAWANRTIAQLLTDLAAPGTTFQPLDSDLTAIAALATTAYGRSLLEAANASALRTLAGLVIGTDVPAKAYGTFVRRTHTLLTDKTAWSAAANTNEQWGTEEATIASSGLPKLTDVTIFALVSGYASNINETGLLGVMVELSTDSGSTWQGVTGDIENQLRVPTNQNANLRQMVQATNELDNVTVTGDIMARAVARNGVGAASVIDLENGKLHLEVIVPA